jgi:DNA modification methylase
VERRDISNVWEDISTVKHEWDGHYTTITFQGFKVKILGQIEKGSVIKKKQRVDIIRHDKPIKSAEHPTMKPVSLVVEAISNSSQNGDIVMDTFLGSGTTLIAAEKAGRICYGCELDPHYVDIAVRRWEDFTKLKAKKI